MAFHPKLQKFYFFAENYHVGLTADTYFYQTVTYGGEGGVSRKTDAWKNADTYTYHCADILVMEVNANDLQVSRHFLVPKRQFEKLTENVENGYPGIRNAAWNAPPNDLLLSQTVAPLHIIPLSDSIGETIRSIWYIMNSRVKKKPHRTKIL